ncbi:MAG TPA: acetate uptake transporter [Dermatophilaceae bacterium]|jgi:succinate-acetate transporter protein
MSTVSLENRVSPVRTTVDLAAKMDAGPIALAAFASSTLVLSAVNAQLIDKSAIQAVIASAWVMGGLVQFVVGVFCLTKGRLFGGVAFTSFGGFWLSFAVYETFYVSKIPPAEHGHATALFLAPWLIFTLFLWLASFRTSRALVVGLGALLVTIATLVLGQATSSESWLKIGGFLGLVLALGVFYIAGAELINQVYARQILPLGDLNVGEEHRDADRG